MGTGEALSGPEMFERQSIFANTIEFASQTVAARNLISGGERYGERKPATRSPALPIPGTRNRSTESP
jgi:hypothetical protein